MTWWVGLGNPGRQAAFLSGVRARRCTRKKEPGGLCRLKDQHARVRGDAASWQSPLPGGPAWVRPQQRCLGCARALCLLPRDTRSPFLLQQTRQGWTGWWSSSVRAWLLQGRREHQEDVWHEREEPIA